ncbi:DUF2147 domain-containing protein [Pseudoduganella violacea]|uniref:Uncharacterized protein (DUF2147 family) n=1 Tax=Pseudoduganella violacea TaxID=1715466 RepID=A0A7W5B821_9BURK|nr:DUF2147 domain-containing protein [Pseudoduganella violacea]MBB3118259.1 uncharacterized protein (DUF2147 family) [Pseudoduganella violacea]
MKQTLKLSLAVTVLLASGAYAHAAGDEAPETGRWVTENGNLEVEIAACGESYCGIVTQVLANNAMIGLGGEKVPVDPNAPSPVGKKILFDLLPMTSGGWQGRIYNRSSNKTYNSQLVAQGQGRLQVRIYEDDPAKGVIQVWRRRGLAAQ